MRTGSQIQIVFDKNQNLTWEQVLPMFKNYGVYWADERELGWMRMTWDALEASGFTYYDHVRSPIPVMWHAAAMCWIYHTFNDLMYNLSSDITDWLPGEMFSLIKGKNLSAEDIIELNKMNFYNDTLEYSLLIVHNCLNQKYSNNIDSIDANYLIFEDLASLYYTDGYIGLKEIDLPFDEIELKHNHPDLFEYMVDDKTGKILYWISNGFKIQW